MGTMGDISSALEVFLNDMRYINPRFTYLLTYLLIPLAGVQGKSPGRVFGDKFPHIVRKPM